MSILNHPSAPQVLRDGAHVGADSKRKLIHSVVATAANVADSRMLPHLLHGEECAWGNQAYLGQSG